MPIGWLPEFWIADAGIHVARLVPPRRTRRCLCGFAYCPAAVLRRVCRLPNAAWSDAAAASLYFLRPRPPRQAAPPREPTRQQTLHGRVLHLRVAAFFLRIGGANLTLLVDAQASASDATTAHKQAASSLFIPVSTSTQLATAAVVPRIPGAAAASELPAVDLHLVQTDPRTAHLPASMASAVATCRLQP